MKKILSLVLVSLLVLTGCTKKESKVVTSNTNVSRLINNSTYVIEVESSKDLNTISKIVNEPDELKTVNLNKRLDDHKPRLMFNVNYVDGTYDTLTLEEDLIVYKDQVFEGTFNTKEMFKKYYNEFSNKANLNQVFNYTLQDKLVDLKEVDIDGQSYYLDSNQVYHKYYRLNQELSLEALNELLEKETIFDKVSKKEIINSYLESIKVSPDFVSVSTISDSGSEFKGIEALSLDLDNLFYPNYNLSLPSFKLEVPKTFQSDEYVLGVYFLPSVSYLKEDNKVLYNYDTSYGKNQAYMEGIIDLRISKVK